MAKKVLPPRRFPVITELNGAAPTGSTMLVADTDKFCVDCTNLVLPDAVRTDIERTFEVGVITAVGSDIDDLVPGDVILYRTQAAYRLPNGMLPAFMFKIDHYAVICKIGEDPDYLNEALAVVAADAEFEEKIQEEENAPRIITSSRPQGKKPTGKIII